MDMEFKGFRDLQCTLLPDGQELVVACDSLGAIGPHAGDVVSCSAEITGYFTAAVALAEILAYGAQPVLVADNLCYSMEPHGKGTIEGIQKALERAGYPLCPITGSTEENMPVMQTAMGITVLGIVPKQGRRHRRVQRGDACFLVGTPLVGEEVLAELKSIRTLEYLTLLKEEEGVGDLLPVGSKGVRAEMLELAHTHGLDVHWFAENPVWDRSAGPATCFLVVGSEPVMEKILKKQGITSQKLAFLE